MLARVFDLIGRTDLSKEPILIPCKLRNFESDRVRT